MIEVQNPAPASLPPRDCLLEELWRVGDDEGAPDYFGVVVDAAMDAAGDVYFLDSQRVQVMRYSAGGEYLGAIGREGEGPGEFRYPVAVFVMPDGRIGVLQWRPPRALLFAPEGTPAGEIPLPAPEDGGFPFVYDADVRANTLLLNGMTSQRETLGFARTHHLALLSLDGKHPPVDVVDWSYHVRPRVPIDEIDRYHLWALLPDGRLAVAEDFDYRLRLWRADGSLERVITADYPDLPRSEDEMAQARSYYLSGRRDHSLDDEMQVETREPGVRRLQVDGAGRLWVLSGRGARAASASSLGVFDVFDGEGRLHWRVRLLGDGDPERDLYLVVGDRLFVLKEFTAARVSQRGGDAAALEGEDSAAPMSVVCYRLPELEP
ncbi:MAG: hypothetical protein R3C71_04425 [Candidatus Krumholzibacteriia bacterium]|nr:hypothetical protein [bacterium]MCB9513136.1 hypothetical protein [Candidatus Latescibacterota bacterium]